MQPLSKVCNLQEAGVKPVLMVWNPQEAAVKQFANFSIKIGMVFESPGGCCEAIIDGLESPGGCCEAMCALFQRRIDSLEFPGRCWEAFTQF